MPTSNQIPTTNVVRHTKHRLEMSWLIFLSVSSQCLSSVISHP